MSQVIVTETSLENIADAIRAKLGVATEYKPGEMAEAIQSIPTGGSAVVQPLSVTQNGTYNPPSGVDGYAPVTVNVSGGGPDIYPAVHVWTKDAAAYNANLYIQTGHVVNNSFVGDDTPVVLGYSSAATAIEYGGLVSVQYLEASGGGPNWRVKAVAEVVYNYNTYSSGDALDTWPYNQSRDIVAISSSGSGSIPVILEADWNAMTTAQKQSYGLCIIQTASSGFERGKYVNGADYVPVPSITQQGYKKANAGAVTPTITATAKQLLVIALNTEASSKQMDTTVTLNGNTLTEDWAEYHQYVSSGTNRRNYRISVYSGTFSPNDSLSIAVTNYGSYSLVIYALLDEESLASLENAITTADAVASGSYADALYVLYGTDSGGNSANIAGLLFNDGSAVTTSNPGSSYSAGFIFWFN